MGSRNVSYHSLTTKIGRGNENVWNGFAFNLNTIKKGLLSKALHQMNDAYCCWNSDVKNSFISFQLAESAAALYLIGILNFSPIAVALGFVNA
jgi:hypothetical protein